MKPKSRGLEQDNLLRSRLNSMIYMRHELLKLAALIGWDLFEAEWAGFFPSHTRPKRAFVERGYRGHGVETPAVYIAGWRRRMTPALQRDLRRRSAIEPMIGHIKTDYRLSCCALKGTLGGARHDVLCGCRHNILMFLAKLRALWVPILATLLGAVGQRAALHYLFAA